MVQRGVNPVLIEDGRIINVDMAHWTVDVRTMHSQRQLLDMQVGAPYLHFTAGEGIYAMPEVGAKVKTCSPSDGSPFILCFITTFEREGQPAGDEGETTTRPTTETSSEGGDAPSEVTYRAGRPKLQQGDIMMRCRDGNQIWLHRGGVIEIGATWIAKRYYIPLLNTVRDVAENWEALTVAGDMMWHVERADSSQSRETREDEATFTLLAKNLAQDQFATVLVRAGHVDDTKRFKIVVAPNAIDTRTGEVSSGAVYSMEVDEEGNLDVSVEKDTTITINGDLSLTVNGDADATYGSNLTENVSGNHEETISGSHKLEAASSEERINGSKTVTCPMIKMGSSGASTPVVLATPMVIQFFLSHTHPVVGGATLQPTIPVPVSSLAARKLYGE